jgi:large subunit ribosomal protein L31
MKAKIHSTYHQATVTCACGNTFVVGSTKADIRVDICSKCHPFFTGEMKFVDVMGRVEKFQKKQAATVGHTYVNKKQKAVLKKKAEEEAEAKIPKSLKEMLDRVKSKSSV